MSRFESRERLAGKIEWEGGIEESFSYGITSEDMPEGDEELEEAWGKAETAYWAFMDTIGELVEVAPELER